MDPGPLIGGGDNPYQIWDLTRVGSTPEGTGIYTIKSRAFPDKCVAAVNKNQAVEQRTCNSGQQSQRWVVDLGEEHTTIASTKFKNFVLQGNGIDTRVTLVGASLNHQPNQTWSVISYP